MPAFVVYDEELNELDGILLDPKTAAEDERVFLMMLDDPVGPETEVKLNVLEFTG